MTAISITENHQLHHIPGHPEGKERLDAVCSKIVASDFYPSLSKLDPVNVETNVLSLIHSPAYLDRLVQISLQDEGHLDPDTYFTNHSYRLAKEAVGAVLACTQSVIKGDVSNAMALVRPPGHHARPSNGMGFCLLNNVAIAAKWAQNHFGLGRIAIVDFDVHHGNGTQEAFYHDPDILFVSLHHAPPFYPGTGSVGEIGVGEGRGTTVNIAFPHGAGDDAYGYAFQKIVHPVLTRFKPEILFISAGYDAHWQDPLADMKLSLAGFDDMVHSLLEAADTFCDGRMVATLEGGYDLESLSEGVAHTLSLLVNEKNRLPDHLGPTPFPERPLRAFLDDIVPFFSL